MKRKTNGWWEVHNAWTGMEQVDTTETLNTFERLEDAQQWADAHTNAQDQVVLCEGQPFWDVQK